MTWYRQALTLVISLAEPGQNYTSCFSLSIFSSLLTTCHPLPLTRATVQWLVFYSSLFLLHHTSRFFLNVDGDIPSSASPRSTLYFVFRSKYLLITHPLHWPPGHAYYPPIPSCAAGADIWLQCCGLKNKINSRLISTVEEVARGVTEGNYEVGRGRKISKE